MSDRCAMCRKGRFVFVFMALSAIAVPSGSWARLGVDYQMQLGNPTAATVDANNFTNYLIQRAQYAMDYNDTFRQPNWVSWSYTTGDSGGSGRSPNFFIDTSLPTGFTQVSTNTFPGYDRGHMCPSGDRTISVADNEVTFLMSNMIPQTAENNQGLWATFEGYCRGLASGGSEILIICGPGNFRTTSISNGMRVPGSVWKVVVVSPSGTALAPDKVTTASRVIAINTPNTASVSTSWTDYITTVEQIEAETGFHFFSSLPTSVGRYLRKVQDTGSGANTPTVITAVSPASGKAGTTVTISGYNFGSSPVVKFNGVTATASVQSGGTQINAIVPASASTGIISVTSTSNGTDTSPEAFAISTSPTPSLTLSTSSLSGFTAVSGTASTSQSYTANGSNLTSNVVVTAPTGYEVSLDNSTFGGSRTLVPTGGSLSGVTVYVRLSASAATGSVAGTLVNSGGGATTQNLTLSGTVVPNSSEGLTSLASWTFETSLPSNSGPYAPEIGVQTATAEARCVHVSSSTAYAANQGNGSAKSFWANTWAVGDYYEFRISTVGLTGIQLSFDQTSSSGGPRDFKISYSINGGGTFSDLITYTVPVSNGAAIVWYPTPVNSASSLSFDLSSFGALNNQSSLILRLVCASSTTLTGGSLSSSGSSRVDNVLVSASATDTTPPVISLNGANPETLVYGQNYADPASASDNSGSVASFAVTGRILNTVVGSYLLTYSAIDGSGNVSTATRTVNVVLNTTNSASADSDGNGMSDLLEYSLGGSPAGNSLAILPSVAVLGDNLQITFQARTNDPNLTIQPVASESLSSAEWSASGVTKVSAAPLSGKEGFEIQTWETSIKNVPQKFLKVRISR
jgi:DNA/RNA endonuclease G (NUC1)